MNVGRVPLNDDLTSATAWGDPVALEPVFARLRRDCPVAWVDQEPYRPFWAVTRHADIIAIERQHALFVNGPRLNLIPKHVEAQAANGMAGGLRETFRVLTVLARLSRRPWGDTLEGLQAIRAARSTGARQRVRTLIDMDEPEHRKFRELTQAWFMGKGVSRLEAHVGAMVERSVGRMREHGTAPFDFAQEVALQYPLSVILSVLGLPETDGPFLLRATQQLLSSADPDLEGDSNYGISTVTELFEYFAAVVRERRKRPTDDLTSLIANAKIDGKPLGPIETLSYLLITATAGHETTAASVAGGFLAFAQNPDQHRLLVDQPDLLRPAADEVVRWVTPVRHFCRTATADTVVGDQTIGAGESVVLFFGSGNRDEQAFTAPDSFRIDRKPNLHLAFGHGVHHCLGRMLALAEIRAFFGAVLPELRTIELAGEPAPIASNFTGGYKRLPVRCQWN